MFVADPDELDFGRILYPYLANGVPTIQVMSATPDHIEVRGEIERG